MNQDLIALPAVPLRGLVAFPYTVLSFEVGRAASLAAVYAAAEGTGEIFLAAQKDAHLEEPGQGDLYEIGVVAKVRQVVRLQNQMARVLVEGQYRARLIRLEKEKEQLDAILNTYLK